MVRPIKLNRNIGLATGMNAEKLQLAETSDTWVQDIVRQSSSNAWFSINNKLCIKVAARQ